MYFDPSWFEWARSKLPLRPHLPLIDSREIDMREALAEVWTYDLREDEPVIASWVEDLMRSGPPHDPNDSFERFVVLNFFFRLTEPFDWSDHPKVKAKVEEARESFRRQLRYLVNLRDVDTCTDRPTLLWEITNACAVEEWTRAKRLFEQIKELQISEDLAKDDARLGRILILSLHPRDQWDLSWWLPKKEDAFLANIVTFIMGLSLDGTLLRRKSDALQQVSVSRI